MRRRSPLVVTTRTNTGIQLKYLTQSNIKGAYSATYRGSQRSFDSYSIFSDRVKSILRQILITTILITGFISCIDFEPMNFTLFAIGSFDRSVDYGFSSGPNIYTRTVSANKRNDWFIGDNWFSILISNFRADSGWSQFLVHKILV